MPIPASILVYGRDPDLIETRRMLLQKAGFQVSITMKFTDFEESASSKPMDLFIFCHTLQADECGQALAVSHGLHPQTKNLVLTATTSNCPVGPQDGVLSIFEGPRALLATVREMLSRSEAPQPSV